MTREEIKDFCDMKAQLEPENEDIFKAIIKTLEQEPKSEWEHDHEILKAYADGGNNVLDKVRAEIIELRSKQNVGVLECLDIIDKYKSESEG